MCRYKRTALYLIMIATFSCNTSLNRSIDKSILTIYQEKNEIVKYFDGISILRRGTFVQLNIYKHSLCNEYFIEEQTPRRDSKKSYVLIRDSLQFDIASLQRFKYFNTKDSIKYKDSITRIFVSFLVKMQNLNINSVSSDFSSDGIALKIYLTDYEMLYVPNLDSVINNEWKKYIKSANKIDENWYWREYDVEK